MERLYNEAYDELVADGDDVVNVEQLIDKYLFMGYDIEKSIEYALETNNLSYDKDGDIISKLEVRT